jgi:hypothetical protein
MGHGASLFSTYRLYIRDMLWFNWCLFHSRLTMFTGCILAPTLNSLHVVAKLMLAVSRSASIWSYDWPIEIEEPVGLYIICRPICRFLCGKSISNLHRWQAVYACRLQPKKPRKTSCEIYAWRWLLLSADCLYLAFWRALAYGMRKWYLIIILDIKNSNIWYQEVELLI